MRNTRDDQRLGKGPLVVAVKMEDDRWAVYRGTATSIDIEIKPDMPIAMKLEIAAVQLKFVEKTLDLERMDTTILHND